MKKNKLFWIMLALCAANLAAQLCVYPALPEMVPMHWGVNGQADGWGDKWQVLVIALLPFGIVLMMQVVRRIDPKHENFARFEKAWNVFTLLMTLFMIGMSWMSALDSFGLMPGGESMVSVLVLGGCGAAVAGYQMFAHVKKRVAIWLNPWSDYDNAGYQIVQGLMALASGGLIGCGLGLGSPKTIPVYHTDFIFAVICEQFGLIFGLCVLAMYVAIIWRGATTAMAARRSFHGLLAMGCTVLIALQTFTIIGGVIKLVPLTGVTMPFVSYGGTSLVSSLCLVGLLQGVGSLNNDDLDEDTELAMMGDGEGAA